MIAMSLSVLMDAIVVAGILIFLRLRKCVVFCSPFSMNFTLALVCAPRAAANAFISSSVLIGIFCCSSFSGFLAL